MLQNLRKPLRREPLQRHRPDGVGRLGRARCRRWHRIFPRSALSLALLTKPEGVAVFWPAAGVAAGVLIALRAACALAGRRRHDGGNHPGKSLRRPKSLERRSVRRLQCGRGGADGMDHRARLRPGFRLGRLRHVLGLFAAAMVGTALSAIGGTAGIRLFHNADAPLFATWQHWFASDALGIITLAPLLIEFAALPRDRPSRSEIIEGVLAVVGAGAGMRRLPCSSAGNSWPPSGRLRCCSRRYYGLRRVAGRSSRRPPHSSSAFRSFGRRRSVSAISVIRGCRWPIASSAPRPASCW